LTPSLEVVLMMEPEMIGRAAHGII